MRRDSISSTRPAVSSSPGLPPEILLIGVVCIVLMMLGAAVHAWHPVRQLLTFAGGIAALVLLSSSRGFAENMWQALRRGPNPFLIGLSVWALIGLVTTPVPEYRGSAIIEILRILTGVAVYFIVAYGPKTSRQVLYLTLGLIAVPIGFGMFDMSHIGQRGGFHEGARIPFYATHEELGTLLMLGFPICIAIAVAPRLEERGRLFGFAGALFLGITLLIAQSRSSWFGTAMALLALGALHLRLRQIPASPSSSSARHSPRARPLRSLLASPFLWVTVGCIIFLLFTGSTGFVSGRATALMKNYSRGGVAGALGVRLHYWKATARMAAERPWTGWGPGSYPLIQSRWTHSGHDVAEALKDEFGHLNIAHDYYVQTAAEAGGIGLTLHVAAVLAFLIAGWQVLPRHQDPFGRALLLGSMATIVGAAADAIASPSYNFHGPYAFYMAIMGLGVAAMRSSSGSRSRSRTDPAAEEVALPPHSPVSLLSSIGIGVLLSLGVIAWGITQQRSGLGAPLGTLRLVVTPASPVPADTPVTWLALFTDSQGRPQPTHPGTLWNVSGDEATLRAIHAVKARSVHVIKKSRGVKEYETQAAVRIPLPVTAGPVTATAIYMDEQGRTYRTGATVTVKQPKQPSPKP